MGGGNIDTAPMTNSPLHFDLDRLRDLVWLRTFRTPLVVRTQGLLVIAEFDDQTVGVWRVEELEKNAQEMMP